MSTWDELRAICDRRDAALTEATTDVATLTAERDQARTDLATLRAEFDTYVTIHPDLPKPLQVGVQFHAVWERTGATFGDVHRDLLTKLKAAGVTTVRIDTSWRAWEPTRGTFPARIYNGKLDDTLDWLKANEMRALVTVNEAPTWAAGGVLRRLPDDPTVCEGIGRASTAHLSQWGATVAGVEFWNEPNLKDFDDLGPRPRHYADCLTAFHRGAKSGAGRTVPVVFGATEAICVAPVGTKPVKGREHFINYVYEKVAGGARPWDVMAVHCYPGDEAVTTPSNGSQPWRPTHLEHLFAVMDANGDTSDVFLTEFGWSSHANTAIGTTAQPAWQTGVTEARQAELTAAMFAFLVAEHPRVKLAVLYNDWEKGDPGKAITYAARHQYGFGATRSADRSPKPVLNALKQAAAQIRTASA